MNAVPEQPAVRNDAARALGDLAQHTGDYLRAWSELFTDEAQLARICVNRLLLATLCLCALVLGIVVAGNALAAAILQRWLHDWATAFALTLLLDCIALAVVLLAMRAWWRNVSLPRSRRALRELMQRLHEAHHSDSAD
jgi:hypothetical protein